VKCVLLLPDFDQNSDVTTNVSNAPIPNLIKIRSALVSVDMCMTNLVEVSDAFLQFRFSNAPEIRVFIRKENKYNTRFMCRENKKIYTKKLKIRFPNKILYKDCFMTQLYTFLVLCIRYECADNHNLTEFIMFQ
jgi:hypothetical protein